MKNKTTMLLMISTAIYFFVTGLSLSFLPQEITDFFNTGKSAITTIALQIIGALYIGFGMMNWMVRHNRFGGIYNRPIVFGNFLNFLIATLALAKAIETFSQPQRMVIVSISLFYLFFTLCFSYILLLKKINSK